MRQARHRNKVKPLPIFIVVGILIAVLFFGIQHMRNTGALDGAVEKAKAKTEGRATTNTKKGNASVDAIKVVLSPFGGYAGGPYFNEGFKPNDNSRFTNEYGINVEFVVNDDQDASIQQWINDEIDVHWFTVGAMSTIYDKIAAHQPVFLFQTDWSRGGDAIVAKRGINNASAMKGRKVAFVPNSPSHTAILGLLKANNMSISDIQEVRVGTPMEAAQMFKNGAVDVAVVWSPDDAQCVKAVAGSKVLMSTKQATHIIADCFFVKKAKYDANPEKYNKLAEGWVRGNGEINSDASTKSKAAGILATGFADGTAQDYIGAINNVRLTSYGDNKNFFGLNPVYEGMTGDKLYTNIAKMYSKNNVIVGGSWGMVSDGRAISGMDASKFTRSGDMAEKKATFKTKTAAQATSSFAKSTVQVRFSSGSAVLSDAVKAKLDRELGPTLEEFGSVQVRLEGHTDSDGSAQSNIILSRKRAQSIANYFIDEYGMDSNRFIVVGKGEDSPLADERTDRGAKAKNRRVEAYLLN